MIQVKKSVFTKLVVATALIATPIMSNNLDIVIAQHKLLDGKLHPIMNKKEVKDETSNRRWQGHPVEQGMKIHMVDSEAVVTTNNSTSTIPKHEFVALVGTEDVYGANVIEVPYGYQKDFRIEVSRKNGFMPIKIYRYADLGSEVKGHFDVPERLYCEDKSLYNTRFLKVKDDLGKVWFVDRDQVDVKVTTNKKFRVVGSTITDKMRNDTYVLTERTNLSKQEILKVTAGTSLEGIEDAVIEVEQTYGINALFTLALAAHESGWGRSYLARDRNNLFGICAYDSNVNAATGYSSKSECVLKWGKLIHDEYFSRGRTDLYSINAIYASDATWAYQVSNTMHSIHSRI